MAYSLFEMKTDGPITAPRWAHHLVVKVGTHSSAILTASFIFSFFDVVKQPILLGAIIGGPTLFMLIRILQWIHPSDPAKYTWWEHMTDFLTDGSDALLPAGMAVCIAGFILPGAGIIAAAILLWAVCHEGARP